MPSFGMGNLYSHTHSTHAEINLTPMANIILNKGKLKAFLLISRRRGCPLNLLLLYIVLDVLTRALRQVKEIRDRNKKEAKLFLFVDEMILHLRASRHHQKTPITNKYFQQSGKIQKSVPYQYKNSKYTEK